MQSWVYTPPAHRFRGQDQECIGRKFTADWDALKDALKGDLKNALTGALKDALTADLKDALKSAIPRTASHKMVIWI